MFHFLQIPSILIIRLRNVSGLFILSNNERKRSGKPERLLRAAQRDNPQPPKIPTIRTSWLARSFCRLPHNPRFVVFFCHTFCNQPFFHSDVFTKPLFQSTHKKQKDAPEKNNPKLLYITCSYGRSLA